MVEKESKPFVILKLDDLWNKNDVVHSGWREVMAFLNEEKVVGTIGLIGESLEGGSEAYYQWIKDRHREGHEIWHHGFCHCKPIIDDVEKREFRGTSFEYQLRQLYKTQKLAQDKLGIVLRSFGAPYNAVDEFTAFALKEIPEIKVWMYKESAFPTDKFLLDRIPEVNIEYPVHQPDFEKFKAGYVQHSTEPVLIIQGHPRSWVEKPNRMEEFKKIIRFLQEEKVTFTTPYLFYMHHKGKS